MRHQNVIQYQSREYSRSRFDDKIRFRKLLSYLHPKPNDRILEIGCNRGIVTKRIQAFSPQAFGIDINQEAIRHGVTHNLFVMDATKLDFDDRSFAKIYSSHTIEHLPEPQKMLKEIDRVLQPGGIAILIYPAEPIRGMLVFHSSWVMLRNPFRIREIHLHKFTPKKIQHLLSGTNLRHVESSFSFFMSPQFFTILQKNI